MTPDAPTPENEDSTDDKYEAAMQFYRDFTPDKRVDYFTTIEYIKELHAKLDASDKSQDEKADSIVKYLGGGSAIVTAGALLSLKIDTRQTAVFAALTMASLIPYFIHSIYAICCAVSCRRPRKSTTLPDACAALSIAHYYAKDYVEINQLLILHPINESLQFRTMQKAKEVEKAHNNYIRAVGSLLVPVVWICFAMTYFSFVLPGVGESRGPGPAPGATTASKTP